MELTTERLHLRPFTAADHDAIHAVYADPEVMRHVGHGAHQDDGGDGHRAADLRRRARAPRLLVPRRDRARRRRARGRRRPASARRQADVELGYTLARAAWGRGYATELGRALIEYAFDVLKAPRVVAQVEPANLASRHVLEKLGMTAREERTAYGRPHLLYAVANAVAPRR